MVVGCVVGGNAVEAFVIRESTGEKVSTVRLRGTD
jgi:hypothetical protein